MIGAFAGLSAKRASLARALLNPKEGDIASSESKSKKHWKTISQYYRLGAGGSASKSRSGKKESLRSRLKRWSIMGRPSTIKSPPQIDLEGGPQQAKKEPLKSSLRKSDAAKSHLHVMIAPDAIGEPLPTSKEIKPAKTAMFNPYDHENKSHTHVLIAPDEEGPDPFKEDIHKTSLQIMISPNAKDESNVAQQTTNVSSNMKVLISNDGKGEEITNLSSLQRIMINPNVRDEESDRPQKSTKGLPEGNQIKGNPYHQPNLAHTNVMISSDSAGRSQENTNMTSLQIMINPNVKDEPNIAHQTTNVSPNMKVLISNDGKREENSNMTSLQRIMVNPNVQHEPNVTQQTTNVSSNMKVLISGGGKGEEITNMSPLQRIMINPNVPDEEPDLAKVSPEVLTAAEKIDIDPSSDTSKQTANEVHEMIPSSSSENQGKKEPVEESAAILDSQSQTDEQKTSTSDVGSQTRSDADVMSEPVLEKYKPGKSERRASDLPKGKDLQATSKHEKASSSNLKKKKRRVTLA